MMYTMPKNLLSICVNFTLATQLKFTGEGKIKAAEGEKLSGHHPPPPSEGEHKISRRSCNASCSRRKAPHPQHHIRSTGLNDMHRFTAAG